MKKLMLLLLVMFSINSFGQDYKLFHESSNMLYSSNPLDDATYGIDFDSVRISGVDSVYYNYTFTSWEMMESDTCEFWGGPYCFPQDVPSWIGGRFIYNNISEYRFFTNQDDTLFMDFNIDVGDSLRFYLDSEQQFYLVSEGTDMQNIIGLYDSVRNYRISHYDLSGNTMFSELHGKSVSIGGGFGLIDFFRIDSFPSILEPVTLLGSANEPAGITALTYGMLYFHYPGDVIQYRDYKFNDGGPPWLNYENYITHTFYSRSDEQDSTIYGVARTTYKVDSNLVYYDTIFLRYKRDDAVAEIPFDKIDQENILLHRDFYKTDYCELGLWTYEVVPEYLMYCGDDNCWGYYDIPGPPPSERTIYVAGLGLYDESVAGNGPPPDWYVYSYKVVYFKKDGIECGQQIIVSLDEDMQTEVEVAIFPNPTRDKFEVRSAECEVEKVEIYDLSGKKLIERHFPGEKRNVEVDVSMLNAGMYVCRILLDGREITKKLIIR